MKVRKKYSTDFTVTPNEIHRHGLSLKAIGLYLYIINKPDGWDFSINGTATQVKNGADSIRSALKELEQNRFMIRQRCRKPDGQFGSVAWEIYDKPSGNPMLENPTLDNPRQVNTKVVNTKREWKKLTLKMSNQEVSDLMKEYGVTRKAIVKVTKKYRNYCGANNKKASVSGFKLFLSREKWDFDDCDQETRMKLQLGVFGG